MACDALDAIADTSKRMTLSEARTAYLEAERFAIQFPRNAACQRMRQHAYSAWLRAVRAFRNGDCTTDRPLPEQNLAESGSAHASDS